MAILQSRLVLWGALLLLLGLPSTLGIRGKHRTNSGGLRRRTLKSGMGGMHGGMHNAKGGEVDSADMGMMVDASHDNDTVEQLKDLHAAAVLQEISNDAPKMKLTKKAKKKRAKDEDRKKKNKLTKAKKSKTADKASADKESTKLAGGSGDSLFQDALILNAPDESIEDEFVGKLESTEEGSTAEAMPAPKPEDEFMVNESSDEGSVAVDMTPPEDSSSKDETDPQFENPEQATDPPIEVTGSPATDPPVAVTDPPTDPPAEVTDPPTDPPAEDTDPPTDPPVEVTDPPVEVTDPPTDPPVEVTDPPTDLAVEVTDPPAEVTDPPTVSPTTLQPTSLPTVLPTVSPTTLTPTMAPTDATEAPTGSPTLAPTDLPVTEPPTAPPETDPPTVATSDAEGGDTSETVPATSPPTGAPVQESTDPPTTSPTLGATTLAPTELTCPTAIQITGTLEYNFVFADREPTEAEIESVVDATLEFFIDLLREEYGDSVVDISGNLVSSEFDFGPPPIYTMTFEAVARFSGCAPPLEEVNDILNLSDAQYEQYLTEYVFPIEPAGQHIFVLAARVEFEGSASYVEV